MELLQKFNTIYTLTLIAVKILVLFCKNETRLQRKAGKWITKTPTDSLQKNFHYC